MSITSELASVPVQQLYVELFVDMLTGSVSHSVDLWFEKEIICLGWRPSR